MQKSVPPKVVIVGRPNVGKSSLFNRLVGKKKALVRDEPGVTRDRREGFVEWDKCGFQLIDTGGLDFVPKNELDRKVAAQALTSLRNADLVLVVLDGRAGMTGLDRDWIASVRRLQTPILFVVQKIDHTSQEEQMSDFYEIGASSLYCVSAENSRGISDLLDAILQKISNVPPTPSEAHGLKIAILGRPNVGKSTFFNQLVGSERAIVHEEPGTTRDPVGAKLIWGGHEFRLLDTAGIRRRGRISEVVEKISVQSSLKASHKADCVVFLIDAVEGLTDQDAHVLGEIIDFKPVVLLVNKWDLKARQKKETFLDGLKRLSFDYLPIFFISAKEGRGIEGIYPKILELNQKVQTRLPTSRVNQVFEEIVDKQPLPTFQGKSVRLFYATQTGVCPPTFVVFTNYPKKIHFSYVRYLRNSLKRVFGFEEIPVRILFRARK